VDDGRLGRDHRRDREDDENGYKAWAAARSTSKSGMSAFS
jgi:hypothetical protein